MLKVLGDPTRLAMMQLILESEDALCVCELERHFSLTQPTISHHVKVLREVGLVTTEKRGSWVHCRANRRLLQELARHPVFAGECSQASTAVRAHRREST